MRPLIPLVLTLLCSACATTPEPAEQLAFTDGIVAEYRLGAEERKQLQYYVSDTIRLVRSDSDSERGIRRGRLFDGAALATDEILIEAGTPGVVLSSGANWMAVSFDKSSFLYFVSGAAAGRGLRGNDVGERYYLYLPDFDGREGSVRIGGQTYSAIDSSASAYLLIDRESFYDERTRQARLPGRTLR